MFVHSFSLGLKKENIKIKIKPYLEQKVMSDEELHSKNSMCVSVTRWSDHKNLVHS